MLRTIWEYSQHWNPRALVGNRDLGLNQSNHYPTSTLASDHRVSDRTQRISQQRIRRGQHRRLRKTRGFSLEKRKKIVRLITTSLYLYKAIDGLIEHLYRLSFNWFLITTFTIASISQRHPCAQVLIEGVLHNFQSHSNLHLLLDLGTVQFYQRRLYRNEDEWDVDEGGKFI